MTNNPTQQQRRCPICWNWFTIPPSNPHRRYCSGACRVADWRRRRDTEQLQPALDHIHRDDQQHKDHSTINTPPDPREEDQP